jgi:hypothetical protein
MARPLRVGYLGAIYTCVVEETDAKRSSTVVRIVFCIAVPGIKTGAVFGLESL